MLIQTTRFGEVEIQDQDIQLLLLLQFKVQLQQYLVLDQHRMVLVLLQLRF